MEACRVLEKNLSLAVDTIMHNDLLLRWLGFADWDSYHSFGGLPPKAELQKLKHKDEKAKWTHMFTMGAVFIVRLDMVPSTRALTKKL